MALRDTPHETGVAGGPLGGPASAGGADAGLPCAAHSADSPQGGTSVLQGYLFNIPSSRSWPGTSGSRFQRIRGGPSSKAPVPEAATIIAKGNPPAGCVYRTGQTGRSLHSEIA